MGHPEVLDHTTLAAKPRGTATGRVGADHADILGPGDEERADVEIAGTGDGVDLERGPARVGDLDGVAVVDDALEDREGPDPHQRIDPGSPLNGPTTLAVIQPP